MSDVETVEAYIATEKPDQFAAMREFVDLNTEQKRLKARLSEIEARKRALEPECKNLLFELGDDEDPGHMRIAGHTMYLHPDLYARPKDGDRERTARALVENGLGHLVKEDFNINSLSAWVREVKAKGDAASQQEREQLAGILEYLELTESWSVRTRKAPGR